MRPLIFRPDRKSESHNIEITEQIYGINFNFIINTLTDSILLIFQRYIKKNPINMKLKIAAAAAVRVPVMQNIRPRGRPRGFSFALFITEDPFVPYFWNINF